MPRATARRATCSSSTRSRWLRHRLGRGRRDRRPARAVPPVAARRRSTATSSSKLTASGHLYESFVTAEEIEARNVANGRDPKQGYDNFERDLTDEQKRGVPRRGPRARPCACACPTTDLSFDDLVRGEITFPAGSFTDFVVGAPERRAALHVREPGRRRAHGHHARAARRGPALVAPRARSRSTTRSSTIGRDRRSSRASATCRYVHGRGQQEALQARPRVEPVPPPRARLHPRGAAQLPRPARLVARARPRRVLDRGDGRRLRRRRREPEPGALRPEEGRVDQRRPHPAARRATTSPRASCPTSAGSSSDPTPSREPILREAAPLVQERMQLLGEAPRPARLPVHARRRARVRAAMRMPADRTRPPTCSMPPHAALEPVARLDHRGDRGRAARRASSTDSASSRAIAFGPLRTAISGPADQPAAVRVDGAARPRVHPRPVDGPARARLDSHPSGLAWSGDDDDAQAQARPLVQLAAGDHPAGDHHRRPRHGSHPRARRARCAGAQADRGTGLRPELVVVHRGGARLHRAIARILIDLTDKAEDAVALGLPANGTTVIVPHPKGLE